MRMINGLAQRSHRDACPGAQRGFTLLELMIVVTIIAVLAAIAINSYGYAVRKSKRSEATGCLATQAQFLERFYATNFRYDQTTPGAVATTEATLPTCPADLNGFYTFTLPTVTATGYTVQADVVATSTQRKDTGCTTLSINQIGTKVPATGCW